MNAKRNMSWALAALALHAVPLIVLSAQWQQWKNHAASSSHVVPVQLRFFPSGQAEAANFSGKADSVLATSPGISPVSPEDGLPPLLASPDTPAPHDIPVYLEPHELDDRPQPVAPLAIPFPEMTIPNGLVTAVLVLYIGLDGKVDKIDITDSSLPPELEKVARESFMNAAMHPGFKNGRAVRSVMKVVVEFESRTAY